jgi:preprotein translocase subunit YajC
MMVVDIVPFRRGDMTSRRQNPVGPALIIVLFLAFFVFLLVSRKGDTGTSHSQSESQNR